jgi:hypothetical protein
MVVNDKQLAHAAPGEPRGDRPRADAVMRHQPHQRGAVQLDERRDRRDRQQPGVAQQRRGLHDLGGVEVAEIGDRRRIARSAPGVCDCLRLPVVAEAVEGDQVDPSAGYPLEGELGAAQRSCPAGRAGPVSGRLA